RREPSPKDPSMIAKLGIAGVLGSALPWAAQAWAQRSLDSGLVAVLNACTPLVTLLMAAASGQERLARQRVGGIAIAILGTLLVVRGEVGMGRSVLALGVSVLATVGYAFGAVYTRGHISGKVRSLPAAALQLAIGALVLAPIAGWAYGPPPSALPLSVVLSLLALGLLGTGVSFLIYFTLLERVGATNTSMVTYLVPLVAIAAGAFYRGEHFGPNVIAGGAALIFGVWLAQHQSGATTVAIATRQNQSTRPPST
ncbi:MAG TPA: DMT family transporter, partial [Polyangiaceae bacterium]|nr:DMT family transporter [Polyangiaceae bacterium]